MRVAIFDAHRFEKETFCLANQEFGHELVFFEHRLTEDSAASAQGFEAVCAFVNDRLSRSTLETIQRQGVKLVALRSAGFNHVDGGAAKDLGLKVTRVPAYSPYAIAEHAVALILSLNRKIPKATARVRELNFSLEGLVGFDLYGKTIGVIGTGRIGMTFVRIMRGFGCRVLAFDNNPDQATASQAGFEYVPLDQLYAASDIVSLHVPLTPDTKHMVDERAFLLMKKDVMLINTSRGGLVDTKALIAALKSRHVGAAGLDVYEEEEGIFFQDLSEGVLQDDVLARLMTFPNVLITSHQAFLTREALRNIADSTLASIDEFAHGRPLSNEVRF